MAGSGGEELKFCANCKREIAAVNFVMHEVHCRRNIVLCSVCDEPVARSELEDHMSEEHTHCPECNKQVRAIFTRAGRGAASSASSFILASLMNWRLVVRGLRSSFLRI